MWDEGGQHADRTVNKGPELERQCVMCIRNQKEPTGVAAAQTGREREVL